MLLWQGVGLLHAEKKSSRCAPSHLACRKASVDHSLGGGSGTRSMEPSMPRVAPSELMTPSNDMAARSASFFGRPPKKKNERGGFSKARQGTPHPEGVVSQTSTSHTCHFMAALLRALETCVGITEINLFVKASAPPSPPPSAPLPPSLRDQIEEQLLQREALNVEVAVARDDLFNTAKLTLTQGGAPESVVRLKRMLQPYQLSRQADPFIEHGLELELASILEAIVPPPPATDADDAESSAAATDTAAASTPQKRQQPAAAIASTTSSPPAAPSARRSSASPAARRRVSAGQDDAAEDPRAERVRRAREALAARRPPPAKRSAPGGGEAVRDRIMTRGF